MAIVSNMGGLSQLPRIQSSDRKAYSALKNNSKHFRINELARKACQNINLILERTGKYPREVKKACLFENIDPGLCQGLSLIYMLLLSVDSRNANSIFEVFLANLFELVEDKQSLGCLGDELLETLTFILALTQKVTPISNPFMWKLQKGSVSDKEQLKQIREKYIAISNYVKNPLELINIIKMRNFVFEKLGISLLESTKTQVVAKTLCIFLKGEEAKLANFLQTLFHQFEDPSCFLHIGFDDHSMVLSRKGGQFFLLGACDQIPMIPSTFSIKTPKVTWRRIAKFFHFPIKVETLRASSATKASLRQIADSIFFSSTSQYAGDITVKFTITLMSGKGPSFSMKKIKLLFEDEFNNSLSKVKNWNLPKVRALDVSDIPLVDISCLRIASIYLGKKEVQGLIQAGDSSLREVEVLRANQMLMRVHKEQLDPEFHIKNPLVKGSFQYDTPLSS